MMSPRVDAVLGSCGQMRTVIAEWFDTRPRPGRPAAGAATRPTTPLIRRHGRGGPRRAGIGTIATCRCPRCIVSGSS